MKLGATPMTENGEYLDHAGLRWVNDSGNYSVCMQIKTDKTDLSGLQVGTYSLTYTATYTVNDAFSNNQDILTSYDESFSVEVLDCTA